MGDKLLLILNILGTLYLVYFAGVIVLGLFRKKREFPAAAPRGARSPRLSLIHI